VIALLGYWLYLGIKRNDKVGVIIAVILIALIAVILTGGISLSLT